MHRESAGPKQCLSLFDAVAVVVGIVIGAGIFRTPSLVAAQTGSVGWFLGVWLLGGLISLVGALCYAELAASYPHPGGDYHYLTRAFGGGTGFLFAWARISVIQTGSIAVQAFLVGDYLTAIAPLGEYSPAVYAAMTIVGLTMLNIAGLRLGKMAQNVLSAGVVLGLVVIMLAGWAASRETTEAAAPIASPSSPAIGLAMIFVLLTYGGWNEAAYLSAEVRGGQRSMLHVLLWGIGLITIIYVLTNAALLAGLGLHAMSTSKAVAADLLAKTLGATGAQVISAIVVLAALSTINATMITGARTTYALGRDVAAFNRLGQWNGKSNTPAPALVAQGAIALALVLLGTITRDGFATMVEYTAPVFWGFFLLVGIALIVLRRREPQHARPFRVPLYPFTPLLFCAVCLYMLRASLAYTGVGAWVGVAVLVAGVPLMLLARSSLVVQQQTP